MKTRTQTITEFRQLPRYTPTLIACAALAALHLAAAPVAFAQTPPGYAQSAPPAQGANVDPPGRVARLDYMAGPVTTEPAGATDWSYAQLNRPLTTGDQLWNDANARSELHIGSTAVRLGAQTSVDVLNLDDSTAQLKVAQGTLSTRVRELPAGTSYEIDTPNLALGVNGPGDYRVDVAPDGSTTTVTVRSGNVTVYGENGQMPISAGQQVRFAGADLQQVASNEAPPPDALDQWALARDAAEDRSVSARYVSRDMPGYQDLDANGTWHDDPQYGEVWEPTATPAGWAPYHDGHWVWQAPWGWTWVDDEPWGFAPYHYGRWAYVDDSWAWVPGPMVEDAPPVYAPALVGFVGGGDGGVDWGVSLTAGGIGAAGVAWFALGPGDPWHPRGGDWSPRYYERVNRTVVINNIHNTYVNYRVPGAVTAVPATAFVHGQPVSRFAQRVDPQQWRGAHIESGTPGIAPVAGSFGNNVRRANYRPPADLTQRQVVATRAPVAPPALHDNLAQRFARGGGTVPGAGAPVVRVSAPAHAPLEAARGAWAPQNVRMVTPHSPVMSQASPRPGTMAPQPGRPAGFAANAPVQERGQPGAAPTMANPRAPVQQEHGVPRPPQLAGRPEGEMARAPGGAPNATPGEARQPMWTQPHAPMATRGQPGAGEGARQPQYAMQQPQPAQREALRPQPQAQPQPQPRQAFHPQPQPQAQPRAEIHPQPQPQAQARPEFHPQPQPQVQPRAEFHPQPQPQAQPRPEFHPQPQPQPQPRAEARPQPQPQPQPRAEPRPAPQPQQRASHGRDDHQHG